MKHILSQSQGQILPAKNEAYKSAFLRLSVNVHARYEANKSPFFTIVSKRAYNYANNEANKSAVLRVASKRACQN